MSGEHHRSTEPVRSSSDESKLAELRGREERLETLRARRTDLEVERIAAEVALRAARESGPARTCRARKPMPSCRRSIGCAGSNRGAPRNARTQMPASGRRKS